MAYSDRKSYADSDWKPSSRPRFALTADGVVPLRKSRRLSQRASKNSPPPIIDLTLEPDEEGINTVSPYGKETGPRRLLAEYRARYQAQSNCPSERPRSRYLEAFTTEEDDIFKEITRGSPDSIEIAVVESPTMSRIHLLLSDMKQLRGRRWLNDELINAYVYMINVRNDDMHSYMDAKAREDIPRTYMMNTFFYTCLTRKGYDFPGVSRWTSRAKVMILDYDQLLFPVNLGNTHWVLCMIDVSERHFIFLDSLYRADSHGILRTLSRWLHDEVAEKYGEQRAIGLRLESWKTRANEYLVKRVGVLPKDLEPHPGRKGRWAMIPRQTDSGSCGVFAVKAADCLSMGIKMYYTQQDMALLRKRMTLDLFSATLPL